MQVPRLEPFGSSRYQFGETLGVFVQLFILCRVRRVRLTPTFGRGLAGFLFSFPFSIGHLFVK